MTKARKGLLTTKRMAETVLVTCIPQHPSHETIMPSAYPLLPADPPVPYVKPTLANTNGGKTYKPTHPELFHVEFTSSIDGQEGFSSRLVARRVCTTATTLPSGLR